MDVCLLDDEGGRVAARMRKELSLAKVPIIFLTGLLSDHRGSKEVINRGGFPFLPKPIDISTLVSCIEQHLILPVLP